MELRQFGNTDMKVSLLGFGGAEIGYEGAAQETVNTLLNSALDAGLNTIDTAECYMNSEELIGNAVTGRRDQFYLFTKCGHEKVDGNQVGAWTKPQILASIERSLRRLKTDRVDLVQLHSCSLDELKKGEVIEALQEAREKGYTRYIGYSGDNEAARYAVESGAFDSLQTSINIADQANIDLAVPLAKERNMGIIVKRPIANAAWRTGQKPEEAYHHTYWDRLQELKYDFLENASSSPEKLNESIAIAMRFTATVPGVSTMIVGTKNPNRWQSNAQIIAQGPLPQSQYDAIRTHWTQISKGAWQAET
jgi:aryl-alcohol dehydrogenase-like predicted oxidoreductase